MTSTYSVLLLLPPPECHKGGPRCHHETPPSTSNPHGRRVLFYGPTKGTLVRSNELRTMERKQVAQLLECLVGQKRDTRGVGLDISVLSPWYSLLTLNQLSSSPFSSAPRSLEPSATLPPPHLSHVFLGHPLQVPEAGGAPNMPATKGE